ncbi:hypothetical protein SEVIR_9G361901v4 [Setaria viridis]
MVPPISLPLSSLVHFSPEQKSRATAPLVLLSRNPLHRASNPWRLIGKQVSNASRTPFSPLTEPWHPFSLSPSRHPVLFRERAGSRWATTSSPRGSRWPGARTKAACGRPAMPDALRTRHPRHAASHRRP